MIFFFFFIFRLVLSRRSWNLLESIETSTEIDALLSPFLWCLWLVSSQVYGFLETIIHVVLVVAVHEKSDFWSTLQVGYTNAGKSTLLNQLTGANVLAEDQLFATLDPTTRRVQVSFNIENFSLVSCG